VALLSSFGLRTNPILPAPRLEPLNLRGGLAFQQGVLEESAANNRIQPASGGAELHAERLLDLPFGSAVQGSDRVVRHGWLPH
jgi:hypothetical protein